MNEEKRYCVYVHKDSDGNIRYVGSGRICRANLTCAKSSRGKAYEDFVNSNGNLDFEIIEDNLSKRESLILELELYSNYVKSGLLLNSRHPNIQSVEITKDVLSKVKYSDTSKSGLVWANDILTKTGKKTKIKKGMMCGFISGKGYYSVEIDGSTFLAHRLVFLINNEGVNITDSVIDHIDGNPLNNRLSNLRAISQQENMRNKVPSCKKSGLPNNITLRQDKLGLVIRVTSSILNSDGTYSRVRKMVPFSKYSESIDNYTMSLNEAISIRNSLFSELNLESQIQYTDRHINHGI